MTKVFIGGSRGGSRLSEPIRMRLDRLIEKGLPVIIGDANGADKAVQQYLNSKNYLNVEVFCSGHLCRNNIGNWMQRKVSSTAPNKTFDFYAAKDRTMADNATVGFMVWDGKSKGTLNNIQELIRRGKKTLVYLAAEKAFHKIVTERDLDALLERCDPDAVRRAQQTISAKLPAQLPL